MTHTELDELYELYVLGALEPEATAEIERHLAEQCSYCMEHVRDATQLAAAMAGMAESQALPVALRARVLGMVAPTTAVPARTAQAPKRARNWIFAVAALSAACLALIAFSVSAWSELQQSNSRLASTVNQRDQLRSALATASSSDRLQVTALTAERNQLRSALAAANSAASSQVAALTSERDRLRSAVATATNAERSEVAALTNERDQLRSALTNANNTAQAQVSALTAERDQLRSALAAANTQQHTQVASLEQERDQLQSALAVIRKPDTQSVRFGTPAAAHGWVFANKNGGLVLIASELPPVPSGRTLELWLVPKSGAPQPAGLFRPTDPAGDTVHVTSVAVDPSQIKAVAVSEEPSAGSAAPTTKPFLLVPLG